MTRAQSKDADAEADDNQYDDSLSNSNHSTSSRSRSSRARSCSSSSVVSDSCPDYYDYDETSHTGVDRLSDTEFAEDDEEEDDEDVEEEREKGTSRRRRRASDSQCPSLSRSYANSKMTTSTASTTRYDDDDEDAEEDQDETEYNEDREDGDDQDEDETEREDSFKENDARFKNLSRFDDDHTGKPFVSSSSSSTPSHQHHQVHLHQHQHPDHYRDDSLTASCTSDLSVTTSSSSFDLLLDLFTLIEREKWRRVQRFLSETYSSVSEVDQLLLATNLLQQTPLHMILASQGAPPSLLLWILQRIQELPDHSPKKYLLAVDEDGNTPLHLACRNLQGAATLADTRLDFSVLKECAAVCPKALLQPNADGDTPFHLLLTSKAFTANTKSFSSSPPSTSSSSSSSSKKRSQQDYYMLEAMAEHILKILLSLVANMGETEQLAKLQNKHGHTLLHVAVTTPTHELVLLELIRTLPAATFIMDWRGMLPLHHVASKCYSKNASSSSSSSTRKKSIIPWTCTRDLIAANPKSICTKTTENGDTPLHLLMANVHGPSASTLKRDPASCFLDRNTVKTAQLLMGTLSVALDDDKAAFASLPQAMLNDEGFTPLHVGAIYNVAPALVRLVLEQAKRSANSSSWFQQLICAVCPSSGVTPLHLACASSYLSEELIQVLCTPKVCEMRDKKGRTPLVVALGNARRKAKVIEILCGTCPDVITAKLPDGSTPMHYLFQHFEQQKKSQGSSSKHSSSSSKKQQQQQDDNSTTSSRQHHRRSLRRKSHTAPVIAAPTTTSSSKNFRTIRSIVKIMVKEALTPEDVLALHDSHGNTPLHLACKYGAPPEVIELLISKFPEAVRMKNRKGAKPIALSDDVHVIRILDRSKCVATF